MAGDAKCCGLRLLAFLPDQVPLWTPFRLYLAMPRNRPKHRHEPLGAREVTIIRRLKQVIKLPVTKIATAVNRNKSTIYDALDKNWRHGKRGRKEWKLRRAVPSPGLAA